MRTTGSSPAASIWNTLGRGVHPKIASEMLRHSTVAITLDLYSHVTENMQREAARAMDELLGGN